MLLCPEFAFIEQVSKIILVRPLTMSTYVSMDKSLSDGCLDL